MSEEVTDCYGGPEFGKIGEEIGESIIERKFPASGQDQNGHGCKLLCERSEAKTGVGGYRKFFFKVGEAKAL